jgi:cytochrome b6-f complex iron-sulfur subunit
MNRRDLINKVLVGGTVLVLSPSVLNSCSKDSTTDPNGGGTGGNNKIELDLTNATNAVLTNTGGWLIVQNVIIINTGGGSYSALSSICTHQGCTVGYNSGAGNIQCPCHGSVYSTSGTVINGPAPRALKSYTVTVTGNLLAVALL